MATNNSCNYQPTNHAVQVGGTNGALTSLAVGTDGQLLVGVSAADPAFGSTANADFTFGAANSGATRTLTVSNTSNTASSAANLLVTVGGSTAADATHQAVISGGQNWTWGLDNSDSDAFVIASSSALGTTNVMRVATTGEINYPLQSAFLASTSLNAQNDVTGDATTYTLVWDTEIFDQNNDFASNTFTAPVTGRYLLTIITEVSSLGALFTAGRINIVTSNRSYPSGVGNWGAMRDASNIVVMSGAAFTDMDAADTATSAVNISGSTKTLDISTTYVSYFGGALIC